MEAPIKPGSSHVPEPQLVIPSTEELKRLIKEAEAKSKELQKQVEAAAIAASKVNATKMAEEGDSKPNDLSKTNSLRENKKGSKNQLQYDKQAGAAPKSTGLPDQNASVEARVSPDVPSTSFTVKQLPTAPFNAVESHTLPSKPLTKEDLEEIEFELKRERARLDELKREEELLKGVRRDREVTPSVEHVKAPREVFDERSVVWTQVSAKQMAESKRAAQKFSKKPDQLSFPQPLPSQHEDLSPIKASDLSPVIRIIDDIPDVPLNDASLLEHQASDSQDSAPVIPKTLQKIDSNVADFPKSSSAKPTNPTPSTPPPLSVNPIRPVPVMSSVATKRVYRKVPVRKTRRRAVKRRSRRPKNLWIPPVQKKHDAGQPQQQMP
jgi:hypothetical protein